MSCLQCQGIEETFSQEYVADELKNYRRRGPAKTTRMLVDALKNQRISGLTLLDIGGGIGSIQHALLDAGAKSATDVDASPAYLSAAKVEAERRGLANRVTYRQGNFVDLAEEIPSADIVTLDRVICCYDGMQELVSRSAARARKFYGLVYPRDTWWTRLGSRIGNLFLRIQKSPFRTFVHPASAVEALITANGLSKRLQRNTLIWQVVIFSR